MAFRSLVSPVCLWLSIIGPGTLAQPLFPSEAELEGKKAGDLVYKRGKYDRYDADWGWLVVPENRAKPDSRDIRIVVLRQPALEKSNAEPIFHLAGGPGNSNVWGIDIAPAFFTDNELVRVGYRGIDSTVELKCPEFHQAMMTDRPLSTESIAKMRAGLRTCYDRLRGEGIDLDAYNVVQVADDLEAARRALGYDRINLLAISWGTQVAYVYALRYPDHVGRVVMVGAGGRERGITNLWPPKIIDKVLADYAAIWRKDPDAAARTPDLLETIRGVMATLPRDWREIGIDPDKVRLSAFYLLRDTKTAALVFDAFVAASQGDYGGLALLSVGYDEELRNKRREYYGEFFCKAITSGLNRNVDFETEMDPSNSLIGSPGAKLLWGAAASGWPVKPVAEEFRSRRDLSAETLVVMGNLDLAAPVDFVREELMPHLKRGHLLVLSDMGHVDVLQLQHEAFEHLAMRFFREGVVDDSKYQPNKIDFSPDDSLVAQAGRLFGGK